MPTGRQFGIRFLENLSGWHETLARTDYVIYTQQDGNVHALQNAARGIIAASNLYFVQLNQIHTTHFLCAFILTGK